MSDITLIPQFADDKTKFLIHLNQLVTECNWTELNNCLESYATCNFKRQILNCMTEEVDVLLIIIQNINNKFLWYNTLEVPLPEILTKVLKILRIYVTNIYVARYLVNKDNFYTVFHELMGCIFTKKNGQELYTKYLLQLFINLLSVGEEQDRKSACTRICNYFFDQFNKHFKECYGYLYESSAIMYNFSINKEIEEEDFIHSVIMYYRNDPIGNEYLGFLLEQIMCQNYFWNYYEKFPIGTRLLLLNYLNECLLNLSYCEMKTRLPACSLTRLVTIFNNSLDVVFQVTQHECVNASQEVSYVLQLLSILSSEENKLKHLQNNIEMFINTCVFLINIHTLGKTSENVFKPIQKLSEIQKPKEDIINNPVFGIKAFLIRLVGNLCWRSKRIQDLARTAEVIPVLLDCCNIDANNPFIMQWVVLAIRNLCENNKENQAVIAGLTQKGFVQNEVLEEFGISQYAEDILARRFIDLNLNNGNTR